MRQPILVLTGVVLFMGGCGRTVPRSPAQPVRAGARLHAAKQPPPQTTPPPSTSP